mgnify:CR=1 FL=1
MWERNICGSVVVSVGSCVWCVCVWCDLILTAQWWRRSAAALTLRHMCVGLLTFREKSRQLENLGLVLMVYECFVLAIVQRFRWLNPISETKHKGESKLFEYSQLWLARHKSGLSGRKESPLEMTGRNQKAKHYSCRLFPCWLHLCLKLSRDGDRNLNFISATISQSTYIITIAN